MRELGSLGVLKGRRFAEWFADFLPRQTFLSPMFSIGYVSAVFACCRPLFVQGRSPHHASTKHALFAIEAGCARGKEFVDQGSDLMWRPSDSGRDVRQATGEATGQAPYLDHSVLGRESRDAKKSHP
jgi:hypothetical protein